MIDVASLERIISASKQINTCHILSQSANGILRSGSIYRFRCLNHDHLKIGRHCYVFMFAIGDALTGPSEQRHHQGGQRGVPTPSFEDRL